MPERLITVSREFVDAEAGIAEAESILYTAGHRQPKNGEAQAQIDAETRAELHAAATIAEITETLPSFRERLAKREPYRMIPKGRRDTDGFQRFSYPPLEKMLQKPPHPLTVTTITIPPTLPFNEAVASGKQSARKPRAERSRHAPVKPQPIKFAQKFPYKDDDWLGHFGMRNLVESSNKLLKTAPHGDIENTTKRSGRGYAAVYLALTFAVVASNLKRIATFFVAEAERLELAVKKHRARRRKDDLGRPLPKPALTAPPGT